MAIRVAVSDDGHLAAKLTVDDDKIELVDLTNRRRVGYRDGNSRTPGLALDPLGQMLSYATDVKTLVIENLILAQPVDYRTHPGKAYQQ